MKSPSSALFLTAAMASAAIPPSLSAASDAPNGSVATNAPPATPYSFAGQYEPGRLGIGVLVGEPTGLSMKYWLTETYAVDGGIGCSFEHRPSFNLHSDFLFHKFDLFPVSRGHLPLYFGAGGRLKVPDRGDTRFGLRAPVGVSYLPPDVPLEFFAEVAPIMDVTPAVQLGWNGGVGIRYYFE